MMPGLSFDVVMNFTWAEIKAWHGAATETWKKLRGIE